MRKEPESCWLLFIVRPTKAADQIETFVFRIVCMRLLLCVVCAS
jgi:hypothetical protein